MKIALIGYGKMGKAIESIALSKGHEIVLKIDIQNNQDFTEAALQKADVAIEFTGPHSAFENVKKCIAWGVPVVSGSTGWLDQWSEIKDLCEAKNGTLIYSSNYSIGVNLFFELNKQLAQLMQPYNSYDVSMTEVHHTEKKDAPSGTAISLAKGVIENSNYTNWTLDQAKEKQIHIGVKRIADVPGTHTVTYASAVDSIEIKHTAHNRDGFALGAVIAAEWIVGKEGVFTMKDVLN